jgi:hypothetical protein
MKIWLLIVVSVVVSAVYVVYFTDWFKPKTIHIFHTHRNLHPQLQREALMPSLIFGVTREVKLTELKVVAVAAFQTNENTLPLWHLVSDSNSVPVKTFFYGQFIRGLKPAVAGARPQPLETNITYRLFLTAGKFKGQHDFELK